MKKNFFLHSLPFRLLVGVAFGICIGLLLNIIDLSLIHIFTREVNFGTGESAITHYERLAAGKEYSLAELHLETGRTHQIRVHMKYIGHPLPGDYLYNPDYRRINRQPLHSYQLEFTHPITGKVMLFTAPLPIDFISAFYSNSLK